MVLFGYMANLSYCSDIVFSQKLNRSINIFLFPTAYDYFSPILSKTSGNGESYPRIEWSTAKEQSWIRVQLIHIALVYAYTAGIGSWRSGI